MHNDKEFVVTQIWIKHCITNHREISMEEKNMVSYTHTHITGTYETKLGQKWRRQETF